MKKIALISLNVLVGLLFLYSAYSKIYLIEYLENNLVDIGFANWTIAPLFARLLISFEFILGILFIAQFKLKKISYPLAIIVLSIFILYLIALIHKYGDTGNCGCFGVKIVMTPLQGILKNIGLILLLAMLYLVNDFQNTEHLAYKIILGLSVITALILPFILNPISINEKAFVKEEKPHTLSLDSLHTYSPQKNWHPEQLKQGKEVIAYLSLYCAHCKITAQKLSLFKEKHPELPIHFILVGHPDFLKQFMVDTKVKNIDYYYTLDAMFDNDSRGSVPKVYLVNNGKVDLFCGKYYLLNYDDIIAWLNDK